MYRDRWYESIWFTLIVIFLVCVGLVGLSCAFANVVIGNFCKNIERLHPDLEVDYTFWSNCRIKTPTGKWIVASEYLQYYGDLRTIQLDIENLE